MNFIYANNIVIMLRNISYEMLSNITCFTDDENVMIKDVGPLPVNI